LRPAAMSRAGRGLSGALGGSRGTVRKALDELERRGLIKRRPGSGTFVTGLAPEYASAQGAAAAVPEISPAKLMEARIAIGPQMATHNPFFAYLLKQINLIRAQSEWGVLKKKSLTAQARAQYQEQHQQILAALKK